METVYWYDVNSQLLKQINCQSIQLSNEREKEMIEVNGNGTTILIQDTSISACTAEEDGRLVIETNAGRKIVFLHTSEKGTLKLLARLNKVLDSSNCTLRFDEPQSEAYIQVLQNLESNQVQQKNSRSDFTVLALMSLGIISVFTIIVMSTNVEKISTKVDSINSSPIAEDAWEARLKREQEERYKQQEELYKQQAKENIPQQTAPTSQNKDTEVAAIMVSVSCAGNKGLIPRSQMGSMMKEMFQDKGIDSTEIYGNWDYYWGIAKEMDAVNKTYCLK